MTAPLLDVDGISVEFATGEGPVRVLDDVSFSVRQNEIVGLVGESGSGKSTAVRSVIRLLPPSGRIASGRVLLEGKDLAGLSRRGLRQVRGEQIGFVAQNPFSALNPVLTIAKQFSNVMRAHRTGNHSAAPDRAAELLASVGIVDPPRVLRGYAHELSGGMAQRVVLALALSLDPKLLIADEPTTALDLTVQRQVLDMMRELIRASERSMLLVTHDLTVVATYCDRVAVMYGGRLVETGDVAEVFNRPRHPYTRGLLASAAGEFAARSRPITHKSGCTAAGCGYVDLCERALPECRTERPLLTVLPTLPDEAGTGRLVACHNPLTAEVADDAHACSS